MLADLPPELLERVCNSCSEDSLKTLRLVSNHINAISTLFAFECIHLSVFKASLRSLEALSKSPSISRLVRTIECHPDILPSWTMADWESHIRDRIDTIRYFQNCLAEGMTHRKAETASEGLIPHTFTEEQLHAGYKAYTDR